MCPVCRVLDAEIGVLCKDCRDDLSMPVPITPEQVESSAHHATDAVLVDLWGRPHRLSTRMQIGRSVDGDGLVIREASVSRSHAELVREAGVWTLRDCGSVNGTLAQDRLVDGTYPLAGRTLVRFGQVAFHFVEEARTLQIGRTPQIATSMIPRIDPTAPPPATDELTEESTDPGLPSVSVRLHGPAAGGGGLVEIERAKLQMTGPQFELMALMVHRMQGEAHQPSLVRGFVRSSELIACLSWDTAEPNDNHVKQLIRRTRRTLIRSGVGDLIESRHRFGYRLRAMPR